MTLDLNIIRFCAEECQRQKSGEMSVYWMLNAWDFAQHSGLKGVPVTRSVILHLGALVEPTKNARGFRVVPVSVPSGVLDNQQTIPHQIESLVVHQDSLSPAEFYKEFEEIHCLIDGNGRVGQILFAWLSETLDDPTFAPDFWKRSRHTVRYGAS